MQTQIHPNASVHTAHMLDLAREKNFKVLFYVGDLDYQMNWMGLEKVIQNLDWEGRVQYNEDNDGKYTPWTFMNYTTGRDQLGGDFQELDTFTFLKIKNAGLQVQREKPELMVDLLKQFIIDPKGNLRGNRDNKKPLK